MSIRRLFGLFAATLALAGSMNAISTVTAAAEPPLPGDDPFYAQPESLSGRAMGEIIDSRPVTLQDFPATVPYSAWQVKYVSQNSHGTPWTTMAIVLRPDNRVEPPVLMANQSWYDSLNPKCGPSYQLRASDSFRSNTGMSGETRNIADELARGWTVVVSDYLGPDGEFAAGYVEGRLTLDGIRAAENFGPAGLSRDTPVIMYGYSGGSRGTEFGAELAPAYAPELNIRGAAAGGLPVDMLAAAAHMNGGPFTSIDLLAAFGLDRAYPEMGLAGYFADPTLREKLTGDCYSAFIPEYAFKRVEDYTIGGIWPLGVPQVAQTVGSLRGGTYGTPVVPLYLASAFVDEFATVGDTDALIADYCGRGVDVMYEKYPVAEHISAEFIQFPRALTWFEQRLAGAPTTATCGMPGNARIG